MAAREMLRASFDRARVRSDFDETDTQAGAARRFDPKQFPQRRPSPPHLPVNELWRDWTTALTGQPKPSALVLNEPRCYHFRVLNPGVSAIGFVTAAAVTTGH
jgi:hypothetical protein